MAEGVSGRDRANRDGENTAVRPFQPAQSGRWGGSRGACRHCLRTGNRNNVLKKPHGLRRWIGNDSLVGTHIILSFFFPGARVKRANRIHIIIHYGARFRVRTLRARAGMTDVTSRTRIAVEMLVEKLEAVRLIVDSDG